jgi:hypothetical protein
MGPALCVGGELCLYAQPAKSKSPKAGAAPPWTTFALAIGGLLIVALAAASVIRFGAFGCRRGWPSVL